MLLLILDTETTGTDPTKDRLVEVAWLRYDTAARAIVDMHSELVDGKDNAAEHINGIPASLLYRGSMGDDVDRLVWSAALGCDCVVAHNAAFDRAWFSTDTQHAKPWVCSCDDIEWPKGGTGSKSLPSLALAHGVPVAHAHRAFDDVLTLARMFQRVAETGSDVDAMMVKAMRPRCRFVSLAPFNQKDEVKAAGFRWDPTAKVWWRNMPPEDTDALPFKVKVPA
jgi:DNA polymerase III subunit epsilon